MTLEERFMAWVKDDNDREPLVLDLDNSHEYILKFPKAEQFLLLFRQRSYGEKGLERNSSFIYGGFYNRANEMIYESGNKFSDICPNHVFRGYMSDICFQFAENVRRYIERLVAEDVEQFSESKLSAENEKKLQSYAEWGLKKEARNLFISDTGGDEISYKNYYDFEYSSDDELLEVIAAPEAKMRREAEHYIAEHRDDILYDVRKAVLQKEAVRALEQQDDGYAHRVKRIIRATRQSGARTVTVTVNKNGENIALRMEAGHLCHEPTYYYSNYYIMAEDRRRFEQKFGHSERIAPEEIVDISYRGKSIYSAEPFEFGQDETSGMAIKM